MKIVDCSPEPGKSSALENFSNQLEHLLQVAPFFRKTGQAEQMMISQMERAFSNKFFLIKNASIEGLEKPFPFILVGPPGVYLLNICEQKGIYRAKDEEWSEMKGRNRQFEPVNPNLTKETLHLARGLGDHLSDHLGLIHDIRPVLVILNPGTHVDSVRPAVRIIMMDGLERFIARLSIETLQLSSEEVEDILSLLTQPPAMDMDGIEADTSGEKAKRELPALKPVLAIEPAVSRNINSIAQKLHFNTRQWIFLVVLGIANIFLLITFLIIILLNT
jgi:hypothetical protein